MSVESAKEIGRLFATFASASDSQILFAITALPPLADEGDDRWASEEYCRGTAYLFLALGDVAASRRLRPAVKLLLQRASFGDPGETMRGMRHWFEGIYAPEWKLLADEYLALVGAERLGTRLWAIDGLTILDDPRAIPVFERAVREGPEEIRSSAAAGLKRLLHPEEIARKAEARRTASDLRRKEHLAREAEDDARFTERRCAACGRPFPDYRSTCKHCGAKQ